MRYSCVAVALTAVGGVAMVLAAKLLVVRQDVEGQTLLKQNRFGWKNSLSSTSMLTFSAKVAAVVQQNVELMKQKSKQNMLNSLLKIMLSKTSCCQKL